jgi:adenine C2-methylase RlmN of 23S rRNA A2503 and tRNA A37
MATLIANLPERYIQNDLRPSLVGLSRAQLMEMLARVGVPEKQRKMRANQLFHWIYHKGVTSFAAMSNIARDLREKLDEAFQIARPEIVMEQKSNDGTMKWLLRLAPDERGQRHEIETVYIPEEDRGTLCISSQVGCTLTCTFCHTGTQKLVRNLTAEEIVGQIMLARDRIKDWPDDLAANPQPPSSGRYITNVVLMGMGEPLYNFDHVKQAMDWSAMAKACHSRVAASRSRPPALCRRSPAPETRSAPCWRFRCMQRRTRSATSWFPSTRNIRWPSCWRPAATTPASPTRAASPSNM